MCLDAQGGIKARRQPFVVVGVWSCQCLVVVQKKVNVIAHFCSCDNNSGFSVIGM